MLYASLDTISNKISNKHLTPLPLHHEHTHTHPTRLWCTFFFRIKATKEELCALSLEEHDWHVKGYCYGSHFRKFPQLTFDDSCFNFWKFCAFWMIKFSRNNQYIENKFNLCQITFMYCYNNDRFLKKSYQNSKTIGRKTLPQLHYKKLPYKH